MFWKARSKAKEELKRQLADFCSKRMAGLTIFVGPSCTDAALEETIHDKAKEMKIVEGLLVPKLDGLM